MVGLVSSIPTEGNFLKPLDVNFAQKCQICVENNMDTFFDHQILANRLVLKLK